MAWTPHFGTSGIRGSVPEELSADIAWQIGYSVATVFNQEPILICHDNRTSSPLLTNAASSGLMAGGSDAHYGGEVITPAVSLYTRHHDLAGAILITGSHIPANMSGIEVLGSDGAPVPPEIERKIEQVNMADAVPVSWQSHGQIRNVLDVGSFWVRKVLDQVDRNVIQEQQYRVVVDAANGTAVPWLLDVLKQLDCEVIGL
ncbi:MAG: hypothetical protein ACFFCH_07330, partial [Promethearchaeota archaeon]